MTTETDIAKLQKQVEKLEKLVRVLLLKQEVMEKQLRTVKSGQHLQSITLSNIQRGK
jgi:hypothetical protein